jgi:rhodanese-related sulfurtransferase
MDSVSVLDVVDVVRSGAIVIDVRNASEYAAGHIPGALFMPLPTVPLRLSELDRRAQVYVICESGARAFQACQFLQQQGFQPVNIEGAMTAWRAAGLPVERGKPHLDRSTRATPSSVAMIQPER